MYGSRLVSGLAAVFGGTAVLFAVFGVVSSPVFFVVSVVFAAAAYLTWYHASGRLARRVYRGVEARATPSNREGGGFGAGPREEWVPPGERGPKRGRERRQAATGDTTGRGGRSATADPDGRADSPDPSPADYRVLDLQPGADESAVQEAYRAKVKEVHPDADGGDEESFKRVQQAYERLLGGSV